jgi:hypothetical protein
MTDAVPQNYTVFEVRQMISDILHDRISRLRKNGAVNVHMHMFYVIHILATYPQYQSMLEPLLNSVLDTILEDCQVFFNMSREQAIDAQKELSELCAWYYGSSQYGYILTLLEAIRRAYPPIIA